MRSLPGGKRFLISVLGPGDLLGEEGFFNGSYIDCAKALERSLVIFLDREKLNSLLLRHPRLAVELVTALSRRCKALYDRIIEVSWSPAKERLVSLLLKLEKSNGMLTKLSQADLAELLGMTRATVNENLKELERAGLIALAHRRISLLDRKGLRSLLQVPARAPRPNSPT